MFIFTEHTTWVSSVAYLKVWNRAPSLFVNLKKRDFRVYEIISFWLAAWRSSRVVRRMNGVLMLSPVSTKMGDRLWVGTPPRYVTKPTRSTQPCILSGVAKLSTCLI